MHHHDHQHNISLVFLSVVIAIFASYTALDLANSVSRGKIRWGWLAGGSLAMGVGIWSMHFIGMLAFSLPGIEIYYDLPLLLLSIVVAVIASALTLFLVSTKSNSIKSYLMGSLGMGAAIAGMHYIGIASMRLPAIIEWNKFYVVLSILIAIVSSFVALAMAFRLKDDMSVKGYMFRGAGGVIMGFAIAGMHYTAMAAMKFIPTSGTGFDTERLLATNGLAAAVVVGTIVVLGIALVGSNLDRALSSKTMMTDSLKEAIRGRDEFLSIASHELKTPLTSIKLQVQMIRRNLFNEQIEPDKVQHMLDQADRSVDRITRLVDDMLDISRLATGKLKIQVEEFDIAEFLQDVVDRLGPLLHEAGSELHFDRPEAFNGVWDRFRMEQVVTNLLTNAARYGEGKPVTVKCVCASDSVTISVKDEGRGISEEDIQRIFQKFERAAVVPEQRGLGLGLFIVQELVSMHGGQVEVRSCLNEGSEFRIILPRIVSMNGN